MPRKPKQRQCIDCKHTFPVGKLNHRGRCPKCAHKAAVQAAEDMQDKRGKFYTRFLEGEWKYLSRKKRR